MIGEAIPEKTHAKRSPSSAKRRALCPGSVALEAGAPRRSTRYAAEGTVAHQVMELCVAEQQDAEAYVGRVFEADGYSFTVGMEMADAVNECLAFVNLWVDPDLGDLLMPESAVPIGHITGEAGAEGTSDIIGISDNGTRLVVLDLKYGKGIVVFARDEFGELNMQLAYYALGALELVGALYPGITDVTVGIMQPRTFNFDVVSLPVVELLEICDKLKAVEADADAAELIADVAGLMELGLLNPSRDACQFCGAKDTCPARNGSFDASKPSAVADDDDFEDLSV